MSKNKRRICIIVLSITFYFLFTYLNNKIITNENYKIAYVVTDEIKRGDIITPNKISVIKILKNVQNNSIEYSELPVDKIATCDLIRGQIVLDDMVINQEEYIMPNIENEIISIKLNSSDDAVSYQIEKGSIVNIYCTAKMSHIDNIVKNSNLETIYTNDLDGYVTLKLIDNIKILEIYDKQRKEDR